MKAKHKEYQFVYPAIFVKDEEDDSYQVIFPDLNIYTDGANLSRAYLYAKDLLRVYFSYAMKYDTEFNHPSKLEDLLPKERPLFFLSQPDVWKFSELFFKNA